MQDVELEIRKPINELGDSMPLLPPLLLPYYFLFLIFVVCPLFFYVPCGFR